jgi:hypothetical protein
MRNIIPMVPVSADGHTLITRTPAGHPYGHPGTGRAGWICPAFYSPIPLSPQLFGQLIFEPGHAEDESCAGGVAECHCQLDVCDAEVCDE